ncbi:UNVERIFIED_CONTAM: putative mitochondrial protein [Sesamum angustifolium]|uniref:Mitochondrial protein n=1 Tax=Sesamum angustifolium TaxID=2727405 RepID=A0AAW2LW32_9LAMI
MAIKIDLTKAYDRVEWPLLIQILKCIGLCDQFVNWVSQCISSPSFSLLINGASFDFFRPSRGIRQGDPLSPYMFITYAEILSRLLSYEESIGNLKGIKVSRSAPSISHLFYADDLTIFCRAEEEDAQTVRNCLKKFEQWSSQSTNIRKSFIHFSSNVPNRQRRIIREILQMPECSHQAKHLGLPFCKPPSRTHVFNEFTEKMMNRLALWKAKNLSRAGKLVLIKNVAQALPVYQMSTFLVPKKTCLKLDAIIRRFWWKAETIENGDQFLALKSWKSICLPKNKGGLGLQNFSDFNKALVSKLAWQIFQKSKKLWCQVLIAKYLRNGTELFSSVQVQGASWIWQDVVKCAKIIQLGACMPVSTHSNVRIWEDPWIPTLQNFIPKPLLEDHPPWPIYVRDLIEQGTFRWKVDLLQQIVPNDMMQEIQKIQIPISLEPTRPFWAPSKSGKFSTKAAFKAIRNNSMSVSSEDEKIGKRIWSLDLHNRLKLFIWRTLFDTLPTKGKIGQLFQVQSAECLLCDFQIEDAQHIFLCCPFSEKLWMLSTWQQEFITAWALTLELTWKERNDRLHGKEAQPPEAIAQLIHKSTTKYVDSRISRKICSFDNCVWSPPPPDWIKINTDIALKDNKCVTVVVARSHQCRLILAETKEVWLSNSNLAKLRAIRIAAERASCCEFENVIFESDSANAIQWIKGKVEDADREAQIDVFEIKRIWETKPGWDFRKIPRICNSLAHGVSKWAHGANWDGPIPPPPHHFPLDVFGDRGPCSLERNQL